MAFNQVPSSSGGDISSRITNAKGDIIVATAADVVSNLGVGADGTVLTAASGQTTGLQWSTPATGGMTLLASGNISGNINLTGIPGEDYVRLEAHIGGGSNAAYGSYVSYNINSWGDQGYQQSVKATKLLFGNSNTTMVTTLSSPASVTLGQVYSNRRSLVLNILNPKASTGGKLTAAHMGLDDTQVAFMQIAHKNTTTAVSSIQISGFNTGTYRLYGVK